MTRDDVGWWNAVGSHDGMTSQSMTRDVWDEMTWHEISWDDMTWDHLQMSKRWEELRWHDMYCSEIREDYEMRWDEIHVTWHDTMWCEMGLHDMKWHEMAWRYNFLEVTFTFLNHVTVPLLIMITFCSILALFRGFVKSTKTKMADPRWLPFENNLTYFLHHVTPCCGPQRKLFLTYWQPSRFRCQKCNFCRVKGGSGIPTPPPPSSFPWSQKTKKKSGLKSFNLHFSYASSESKRIHNMAAATGVTTAVKAAEEKLTSLSLDSYPPGTEKLR